MEKSTLGELKGYCLQRNDFTAGAKLPAMLWVRHMGDDLYAVDNDKRWDVEENVLSDLVSLSEKHSIAGSKICTLRDVLWRKW